MYDLTDLIFEKYNEGKLSEDKMLLLLEASNTNKEELKRIKEKIKKKEKLTEAEKKKYEMYKKSRNKKIAIGVGIGVGAGIAVKHRLDQLKAEDRKIENQTKLWHEHDEKERKEREKERLEQKEQERKKRDENERIRNDNADLIKQLQKEINMYNKQLVVNKEFLKKIDKELDENEKEINNMRNKMGPGKLVNGMYDSMIAGLKQSREQLLKIYNDTKKVIEKCESEIQSRNNKLDKIDL